MQEIRGVLNANHRRIVIVVSRWNELVTKELLAGAVDELRRYGEPDLTMVHVPGTWEIPLVISELAGRSDRPHAVIALGCILQGQTAHARLLGGDVSGALMGIQREMTLPVAWGILTPDDVEQALDRTGMKHGNKGREAAQAALEMISVLEQL